MSEILLVERMVLESLEKKPLNLAEIHEDTGLDYNLLNNVLSLLLFRGMVCYKKSEYFLNDNKKAEWIKELKKRESMKAELKELFSSLVNGLYKETEEDENYLRVQKIWLTQEEKEMLSVKLKEIDNFIAQIRMCRKLRPKKEATKEKEVLFWGYSSYQSLVDGFLSAV